MVILWGGGGGGGNGLQNTKETGIGTRDLLDTENDVWKGEGRRRRRSDSEEREYLVGEPLFHTLNSLCGCIKSW